MLRRLLVHASHYSLGSLLTAIASFVSFPFLTRVFTVSDYGLTSLVSSTLTLLVAVGKLGVQHALVRFHTRTQPDASGLYGAQVRCTAVLGMAATGLAVTLAWVLVVPFLPLEKLGIGPLRGLLTLVAALILLQVIDSALTGLLRAEQRTGLLVTFQVLKKYTALSLIIGALLLIRRDLPVFYSAQIVTELAGVLFLGIAVFHASSGPAPPCRQAFSVPIYKEMVRYGVPMMLGWELSGVVLSVADRYLVQGFLGQGALGVYAAAYNLCEYVEVVLLLPWGLAIMPIYSRLWEEAGQARTTDFVNRSLRYYVLLGMPIIGGLSAVGPELLTLLASEKYRDGARVIPAVVGGLVCAGAIPIAAAGVFIHKRTWLVARYVLLSACLNVSLNCVLLPAMGIQGAAIATLVSYLLLLYLMTRAGSSHLHIRVPWDAMVRAAAAALAMYAILAPIHLGGRLGTVAARTAIGFVVYSVLILAVEKTAKEGLAALMARIKESAF